MPKKLFDAATLAKALLVTITEAGQAPDDATKLANALQSAYDAGRDDLSTRDMLDVRDAGEVELLSDHAGKVWLNVDGRCVFRAGKVENVKIDLTRDYGEPAVPLFAEPVNGEPVAAVADVASEE